MKFEITRASEWDKQPLLEAKQEEYIYKDYRNVSTLEEAKKYDWYEHWYKRGTNHREENGMIVCDVKYNYGTKTFKRYVIEISSLEDLLNLIEKEGDLVIGTTDQDIYRIIIYDDYL